MICYWAPTGSWLSVISSSDIAPDPSFAYVVLLMFFFHPYYRNVPWGGRSFAERWNRKIPDGPIGESWELVEHEEHHSKSIDSAAQEGEFLGELWRAGKLGGSASGEFPFLLKWLDTRGTLSVQVHPDEAACERLGFGQPKTEAWIVAQAQPGSRIYLGHRPGLDAKKLVDAAKQGTIDDWLLSIEPSAGDMISVPAGTLHAIGPGFVLLEIQQPSNTTFRVFDWNRLGLDGKSRELHLESAAQVVNYAASGDLGLHRHGDQAQVLRGPCFSAERIDAGRRIPPGRLRVVVADQAPLSLSAGGKELNLAVGEVVVLEKSDGELEIRSGEGVWLSEAER